MIAMKKLTSPLAAAIVLVLHAPASWAADTPFTQALAQDYQALSDAERAQGDLRDAETYARRASDAAAAQPTSPEPVELRAAFLKDRYKPDLTQARERLMAAFDGGGRDNAPAAAARAQTSFECWLEQASEDLQTAHIDACREAFVAAVSEVEAAVPAPMVVAAELDSDGDGVMDGADLCPGTPAGTKVDANGCPAILLTLTGVNFKFDSSAIDPTSDQILAQAVTALDSAPAVRVVVVGHADSIGTDAYNLRLSNQRANAVREYLVAHGIAGSRLTAEGRGEREPVQSNDTAAGRFENRRVELRVVGGTQADAQAPQAASEMSSE